MAPDSLDSPSLRLLREWGEVPSTTWLTGSRSARLCIVGDILDPLTRECLTRLVAREELREMLMNFGGVRFADKLEEPDLFRQSDQLLFALTGKSTSAPRLVVYDRAARPLFCSELSPLVSDGGERVGALLKELQRLQIEEPSELEKQAASLGAALAETDDSVVRVGEFSLRRFERALLLKLGAELRNVRAPHSYPGADEVRLLMQLCARKDDPEARRVVGDALTALAHGEALDHVTGAFFETRGASELPRGHCRSGTSSAFAQLFLEAHQLTRSGSHRRVGRAALDYLLRRLRRAGGGFFAGLDVGPRDISSRGQNKDFYVRCLGAELAEPFLHFYGLSGVASTPKRATSWVPLAHTARRFAMNEGMLAENLAHAQALVRDAVEAEVPLLDERIFYEDTAAAISALLLGYRVIGDSRYLEAAEESYAFLQTELRNSRLQRCLGVLRDEPFGGPSPAALGRTLAACLELYRLSDDADLREDILALKTLLVDEPELPAFALEPLLLAARALGDPRAEETVEERIAAFLRTRGADSRHASAAYAALGRALYPRIKLTLRLTEGDGPELSEILASLYLPYREEYWRAARSPSESGLEVEVRGRPPLFLKAEQLRETMVGLVRGGVPRALLQDSRLAGRATAAATDAFLSAHAVHESRRSNFADVSVSRLALGTHRTGLERSEHRRALRRAILGGVNVIDTSPVFAFGDAERLIGEELRYLSEKHLARREALVIVSKLGVFVGEDLRLAATSEKARRAPLRPDIPLRVTFQSLEPDLLTAQLEASLSRLGLETLDVALVPLGHFLEELENGKETEILQWLRVTQERSLVTHLGVVASSADEARRLLLLLSSSKALPIRVLALPINLIERDALEGSPSLVESLNAHGLSVMAHRPLTDLSGGFVRRLVSVAHEPPFSSETLRTAEYRVASLEAEFLTSFIPALHRGKSALAAHRFSLAERLGPTLLKSGSLSQLEQAESTLVSPYLSETLHALGQELAPLVPEQWQKFYEKYLEAAGAYLAAIRAQVAERDRSMLRELGEHFSRPDAVFPDFALESLLECRALSTVAVGTRQSSHSDGLVRLLKS